MSGAEMEPLTLAHLKKFERTRCADIKEILSYLTTKCLENLTTSFDDFFYSVSNRVYSEYALEFYGDACKEGSDSKIHRLPKNQSESNVKTKIAKISNKAD
jgi:hypothetical protein